MGKGSIFAYFGSMNNLIQRSITGLVLGLIIIALVSWNTYSFIFLVVMIDLLSLLEFYRLFHAAGLSPQRVAGILCSAVMILTAALTLGRIGVPRILLINIPVASGIFIYELFRREKNPFYNLALTFLGIICVTIPLCFFIGIAFLPFGSGNYHPGMNLGYFLLLWASDSGAYFFGRALGSHSLFKRISPHKTWEGSLGGAISALSVGYLISHWFSIPGAISWMIIALIIIVTGTLGDLIKSLMKRSLNLKDSGTLLPGHGGMLDRFDSLLGSAPFVFSYLLFFERA
jgi:phosphatidate cytidylyltransferase